MSQTLLNTWYKQLQCLQSIFQSFSVTYNMKQFIVLAIFTIGCCCGDVSKDAETKMSNFLADMWLESSDVLRILWRDCSKKVCITLRIQNQYRINSIIKKYRWNIASSTAIIQRWFKCETNIKNIKSKYILTFTCP